METMPFTEVKAIFANVRDISDYRRLDPEQREKYDDALKRYRDHQCVMDAAREEGIRIGIEKGIGIGIEKVAKQMKALGLDGATISMSTGLSISEIDAL